ncbi:MAG: hypothetical protein KKD44_26960 [Proteobacteria bacterium]|nr:hypothetical protein [Pseudomonadota bacterium]
MKKDKVDQDLRDWLSPSSSHHSLWAEYLFPLEGVKEISMVDGRILHVDVVEVSGDYLTVLEGYKLILVNKAHIVSIEDEGTYKTKDDARNPIWDGKHNGGS